LSEQQVEIAVRSHDVLVTSGTARAAEFDVLSVMGAAVRLAINLRGVPPVSYELLRGVAVHRLGLQPAEVKPALYLLAEAEMVTLDTEGQTIQTVLPSIPYFKNLYEDIGAVGTGNGSLNEHEQLTIELMQSLARGPRTRDTLAALGAERTALTRVLDIGSSAGFILPKRARGQDVFVSPSYFAEDPQALADLAATAGGTRLQKVLQVLAEHQGYPLRVILERGEIAGVRLDPRELAIIKALAGEGFIPPPAIKTTHSGENHFIFGPRPGASRLMPHEVQIYNNALALVAAVRQGQFLSKEYAIRHPRLLLERFRERGFLRSNTEANEQYRSLVQLGVARLEKFGGGWSRLALIKEPDNERALDMAIAILRGAEDQPAPDEELVLALRQGEQYIEPLLARKTLSECTIVSADRDVMAAVDSFLLRGSAK
jgi:hypothetical protein